MQDIIALSKTDEYASSSKLQPDELAVGFHVPHFMVQKMKAFMTSVRTDPSVSDEALLARAKDQVQTLKYFFVASALIIISNFS